MSLTIAVMGRPNKLLKELKANYRIDSGQQGIYVIGGVGIATQIVVESELREDDYFLLQGLKSEQLETEKVNKVFQEIVRLDQRERAEAYLEIFLRVNEEQVKELMMSATLERYLEKWGVAAKFEARGIAEGEARGERVKAQQAVLRVLEARFKSVPVSIKKSVESYTDIIALDSLLQTAAVCESVGEFQETLVR
jgi:hypothetical protein